MVPVPIRTGVSVEEYLAWERQQTGKHEYLHGQIFAVAGGSPRHNRLCVKISSALEAQLGTRCHILSSDQRVRTQKRQYVYPDVAVVCGAMSIESGDVLTNPTIVVEVLSTSTEHHDRGAKCWSRRIRRRSSTTVATIRGGTTRSSRPAAS